MSACVLTQAYDHDQDGKNKTILHLITYISGLFRDSHINLAALTKETYTIYLSVKKLTYYLEDSNITLHSDCLPLRKFLEKHTLNSKVNNWAMEISPFRTKFEYIKGIKNTLVDTISRLIDIDSDIKLEPAPKDHEYGYYIFDQLASITTKCSKLEMLYVLLTVLRKLLLLRMLMLILVLLLPYFNKSKIRMGFIKTF